MSTATEEPGKSGALRRFVQDSAEFTDSVIVAVAGHPINSEGLAPHQIVMRGSPHANYQMMNLYLSGEIAPMGMFCCGPSGAVSTEFVYGTDIPGVAGLDDPAPWGDAVGAALLRCVDRLRTDVAGYSGLAVLCTCGAGPSGTTKVFVGTYGNGVAAAGALQRWEDSQNE